MGWFDKIKKGVMGITGTQHVDASGPGPEPEHNLRSFAEWNTQGLLGAIRRAGEVKQKQAYRTGLNAAADRGIALGSNPGGLSGLASMEIDPRIAAAQAETEGAVQNTIQSEWERLEAARQADLNRKAQAQASKSWWE